MTKPIARAPICRLVRRPDRCRGRQRGRAAFESSSNRTSQSRAIQFRGLRQHPEVEEVRHSAVGNTEKDRHRARVSLRL